jgi:hypothetical protein
VLLEHRETGGLFLRQRIETWQAPNGGELARRVYAENGLLVAGEWRRKGGPHYFYQNAKLWNSPKPEEESLTQDAIWRLTPSAETFAKVTGHPDSLTVE